MYSFLSNRKLSSGNNIAANAERTVLLMLINQVSSRLFVAVGNTCEKLVAVNSKVQIPSK